MVNATPATAPLTAAAARLTRERQRLHTSFNAVAADEERILITEGKGVHLGMKTQLQVRRAW